MLDILGQERRLESNGLVNPQAVLQLQRWQSPDSPYPPAGVASGRWQGGSSSRGSTSGAAHLRRCAHPEAILKQGSFRQMLLGWLCPPQQMSGHQRDFKLP